MTVAEMLSRMSSRELSEWMALYKIEYEEDQVRDLKHKAVAKLEARPKRSR